MRGGGCDLLLGDLVHVAVVQPGGAAADRAAAVVDLVRCDRNDHKPSAPRVRQSSRVLERRDSARRVLVANEDISTPAIAGSESEPAPPRSTFVTTGPDQSLSRPSTKRGSMRASMVRRYSGRRGALSSSPALSHSARNSHRPRRAATAPPRELRQRHPPWPALASNAGVCGVCLRWAQPAGTDLEAARSSIGSSSHVNVECSSRTCSASCAASEPCAGSSGAPANHRSSAAAVSRGSKE